jgi:DNA-binding NtrC family response regulator
MLIADDDEDIVFAFQETFEDETTILTASDGEAALVHLRSGIPQIAFVDITMPKLDGLGVLKEASQSGIKTPIVIITGFGTMSTAINAMKEGAFDYITKPLDIDNLRAVVKKAFELINLRQEVRELKSELVNVRWDDEIIGSHPSMQAVFKRIGMAVQTPVDTNILITGESGTGKELVAKAIHKASAGADQPFLAINCSALPENLIESELFGHVKGAFTGASQYKDGKFKMAGSGIIFLDEIGDLSPAMQVKLLRVLEAREFTPIGGHRLLPVDARFITATNSNLDNSVQEGSFREDLYYRLNVFHISTPPLRERLEDIPALVNFIIERHAARGAKSIKSISAGAMSHLTAYDYPGNVRELQNIIIGAISQENSDILSSDSLPSYLSQSTSAGGSISFEDLPMQEARNHVLQAFESDYLSKVLSRYEGNVTLAAEAAGITRQSFHRLMRKFDIKAADYRK